MTTQTNTETELLLKVLLGPNLEVQRPGTSRDGGRSMWVSPGPRDERRHRVPTGRAPLRLRLVAHDTAGDPIEDPAWTVSVSSQPDGGSWSTLSDTSTLASEFVTKDLAVSGSPLTFRLTVGLSGSGVSIARELVFVLRDPQASNQPDPLDDVTYDAGDLEPLALPPSLPGQPELGIHSSS